MEFDRKPLIVINGLHHTYMRGTPLETIALRGVSLVVHGGEAVGIAGPAGSGKSTLVQYMNGLLRPSSPGQVTVDGQDLGDSHLNLGSLRSKVGLVFQTPEQQLFERLVEDEVAFGPRQLGLPPAEVQERVRWAMEMVGLEHQTFLGRIALSLSGGERRKVALAGVLALRPEVLILDESTSGLDPKGRREFLERMEYLHRQEGLTLVFVSNNMEDLAAVAERLYVLNEGRVVMEGPTREVFAQTEQLKSNGLSSPQMAQVTAALACQGLPLSHIALTVEEAQEAIWRILRP